MSNRPEFARLCRLIDDSVRPYTEILPMSLTKEIEKDLLIALSQVLRQIQLWIHELDCDSYNENEAGTGCNIEYPAFSKSFSEVHHALAKVVGELMVLLATESLYIQHLAETILAVISEFLVASGSYWGEFMHLLCCCLELEICSTLSSSFKSSTTDAYVSDCVSSCFIVALTPRLKYSNWLSVASIVRVLRNILKYLLQDSDANLLHVYLSSVNGTLSKLPWHLLDENRVGLDGKPFRGDILSYFKVRPAESRFIFYGSLLQFFCSLVEVEVERNVLVGAAVGPVDVHPVICKIVSLVPNLLAWHLDKQEEHSNNICISHYFSHKILILMIRLSFRTPLESSVVASWLHLIHKHFQDILSQPIGGQEPDLDDSLEGSPFWINICEVEKQSISSRHVQRLVVFLFVRCCFSLISMRGKNHEECYCANTSSFPTLHLNLDLKCCSSKKGLLELYLWLLGQLPADIFMDCKLYSERCGIFTSSFLQLYMHEDDILFDVLLELFRVPMWSDKQICIGGASKGVNSDIISLVSDVFHPIYLFHLFLAELVYDHQVLLDYLISKDTGASSAEYLLRCLRVACESWTLFVEFPEIAKVTSQSPCKKTKFLADGLDIHGELSSASVKGDGFHFSGDEDCKEDHSHDSEQCRVASLSIEGAKECLLSLKKSLENLYRKNLFPYNPKVLLRRFVCFLHHYTFSILSSRPSS